jgi:glycosyltransferase involved in cell wall biosynthesis
MRILQVFDFISPRRSSGTLMVLAPLCHALARKGHEVTLYTSDYELEEKDLDALSGIKVYPFHNMLDLFGFLITPAINKEAQKNLRNFDIIHLHCFRSFQNEVIHHYAKKYGVPYLVDSHGSLPRTTQKGDWLKWLCKWLFDVVFGYNILKDASKVIAQNEVGAREYETFGITRDRIAEISPPFHVEEFEHLPPPGLFREKYNLKGKRIILFFGRINWIKGIDFLTEAFYELAKLREDVVLVIAGTDQGYKPVLEMLINQLHISDKVIFPGFLRGTDKLSVLSDADVLVQTSRYEQGAGAPFEAILCDTPIIVSDNSGAGADVRKIDAGYLVEYGNRIALRDIMQQVLTHPDEARAKTQKAKEYIINNLSFSRGVEIYEALYTEIVERSQK